MKNVRNALVAAEANKSRKSMFNSLGKKSFATRATFMVGLDSLWGDEEVKLVGPNIKAVGRCQQKVRNEYSGDITRLKDVLRATIIVPDMNALDLVHDELTDMADGDVEDVATGASVGDGGGGSGGGGGGTAMSVEIAGLKNRYYSPSMDIAGYRDCNYSLILDHRLVVELQVQIQAVS